LRSHRNAVGEKDLSAMDITQNFYQQLISKGYDVQYQEFPSVGHVLNDDIKNGVMGFLNNLN